MGSTYYTKLLETKEIKVPNCGLKVTLDHTYPENRSQRYVPGIRQAWPLLPQALRYTFYYILDWIRKKPIVMDFIYPLRSKRIYGVPMGGIGCGTIGRGYRGEFCRFQMQPGVYEYNTVDANQFIVTIKDNQQETIFHSLLSTFPKRSLHSWESLIDDSKCFYTGLYPRSWTEYDLSKFGVVLTCRQISPIIPHNYKDSSLPCTIFEWTIRNISHEERTVTIAFTFKNGVGNKHKDKASTSTSKDFVFGEVQGVILSHSIETMPCSYILSARATPDIEVSKCLYFDPNSDGSEPWFQLKNHGCFDHTIQDVDTILGEMACGIAARALVRPGKFVICEMSLVWDMPIVQFPKKLKQHSRFYTKHFGKENAGVRIVRYAFDNYRKWESEIYKWQSGVLEDSDLPDWYKSALFNETYYVSDGGTIWITLDKEETQNLPQTDPRLEFGKFALLEGHEYKMYNSYDVHFYASFVFVENWPQLQMVVQYDMRDAIFNEIPDRIKSYDGDEFERKKSNTIPHDMGDPGEEPFTLINCYPTHDVSYWKDLNSKFVLQVFRDAFITSLDDESIQYLRDMYEACCVLMHRSENFDTDGDGLIENSGCGDQTYDSWFMTGPSAYCCGLWLAALFAMTKIAEVLHKPEDKKKFQMLLTKGKIAFEQKLWNGRYYNFDSSNDEGHSIMADQLCGHWYLRSCGFTHEVFPQDHVRSALKTIFKNNVLSFCNGKMGAVNGFKNGAVDKFTVQSVEVWTGVTYALAATMIQEGMWYEGFLTGGGMYKSMTDRFGLAFETPEGLYANDFYRAIGYMRPLSIWSMQLAIKTFRRRQEEELHEKNRSTVTLEALSKIQQN